MIRIRCVRHDEVKRALSLLPLLLWGVMIPQLGFGQDQSSSTVEPTGSRIKAEVSAASLMTLAGAAPECTGALQEALVQAVSERIGQFFADITAVATNAGVSVSGRNTLSRAYEKRTFSERRELPKDALLGAAGYEAVVGYRGSYGRLYLYQNRALTLPLRAVQWRAGPMQTEYVFESQWNPDIKRFDERITVVLWRQGKGEIQRQIRGDEVVVWEWSATGQTLKWMLK